MKVFVWMPSGSWNPHADVIMNIKDQQTEAKIEFTLDSIISWRPVHQARNELVRRFLETDCDYLRWVDDDNPPNTDVLQLLLDAKKDVISALVPLRHWWYMLNVFKDWKNLTDTDWLPAVFEVDNAWTWCLLMSRRVVSDVYKKTKHYPFQFKVINDKETSEDVFFGNIAKELGYKYYAHRQARCTHYKKWWELLTTKDLKLSIIIPTLLQGDYYKNILKNISELNLDFDYEIITIKDKLVNDARNEWVAKAKWEYIFIINDDIIIKKWCIEQLMKTVDYYWISCPYYTKQEDYDTIYKTSYGWIVGFAFMMNREAINRCFPIHEDLKIWFGDNWIREKNNRKFIWWWYIHHFESRTLLSDEHRARVNELIENDKKIRALLTNPNTWKL